MKTEWIISIKITLARTNTYTNVLILEYIFCKIADCKNKICEGGSQLDPTSCSCVCNKDIDGHSLNFLTPDSDGCLRKNKLCISLC